MGKGRPREVCQLLIETFAAIFFWLFRFSKLVHLYLAKQQCQYSIFLPALPFRMPLTTAFTFFFNLLPTVTVVK